MLRRPAGARARQSARRPARTASCGRSRSCSGTGIGRPCNTLPASTDSIKAATLGGSIRLCLTHANPCWAQPNTPISAGPAPDCTAMQSCGFGAWCGMIIGIGLRELGMRSDGGNFRRPAMARGVSSTYRGAPPILGLSLVPLVMGTIPTPEATRPKPALHTLCRQESTSPSPSPFSHWDGLPPRCLQPPHRHPELPNPTCAPAPPLPSPGRPATAG